MKSFTRLVFRDLPSSLLRLVALVLLAGSVSATAQTVALPATPGSTLNRVIQTGVLRVCTPGDYKPFSFQTAPAQYEGMDIDLMQSLAKSLNARLDLVKTSWSMLMPDFLAGHCDMAVGGISVTLERQKQAWFSAPYIVNGKAPLTRCENVSRYQTIDAIDRPTVRVIANPGGSNEHFARTRLSHAQLMMNSDNLSIFDALIQGKADVFVTESAEARVQSRAHPELCAVNPDKPLQYSEDAYLLPNGDAIFKAYVDQWLHLTKTSGEFTRVSDRWIGK